MHRRLWLLAGAAAAVLLLAASATAKTKVAGTAAVADGTPAAAPFAQAWAQVPRTTAGRKAANVVVFGAEQDIDGFNTDLSCCNELWAGGWVAIETQSRRVHPEPEGPVDPDRIMHVGVGELEGRVVHDQPERELVLGRQEGPRHLQGLRLHAAADRQPEQRPRRSHRVQQPRPDALHAQGNEAGHVLLEDEELHRPTSRAARTRTGRRCSPVSIRPPPSWAWTSTRSGRTASAARTVSPSRTARTTSRTTRRARARS